MMYNTSKSQHLEYLVLKRNRPDGYPIKVPGFTKLMPMVSGSRTKSTIFFEQDVYLDKTLDFIKEYNKTRPEGTRRLSVFQLFLTAISRALVERPKMNRFVINNTYYQRNHFSVSFVTKTSMHEDAEEVNVMIPLDPEDNIDSMNERFTKYVDHIKDGGSNTSDQAVDTLANVPVFLLRFVMAVYRFLDNHNLVTAGMLRVFPFYSTVFLANLGSVQLDSPFHHLFDMGTNGIFLALGLVKKEKSLEDDGTVRIRKKMRMIFSYDDRIIDGYYAGKAIKAIKRHVENPGLMVEKLELSAEQRSALGITAKGQKLFAI